VLAAAVEKLKEKRTFKSLSYSLLNQSFAISFVSAFHSAAQCAGGGSDFLKCPLFIIITEIWFYKVQRTTADNE
jgi:hypothetical protein